MNLKTIKAKAGASIGSAGVLFGFVAAALAAAAASEEARKEFRGALDVLRAVGLYGWLGLFLAVGLPYLVVWWQRFISKASVRSKPPQEGQEEDEQDQATQPPKGEDKADLTQEQHAKLAKEREDEAKDREEEAKVRRERSRIFWIIFLLTLAFFLTPLWYEAPIGSRRSALFLSSALEISGLISLGLSLLFLFFSLELYDSASGWRGGPRLHFHLAGVASHSFLFGATLALVGLSLSFTFVNEAIGRILVSVSLLTTVLLTEIERYLFLYHQPSLQKDKTEKESETNRSDTSKLQHRPADQHGSSLFLLFP